MDYRKRKIIENIQDLLINIAYHINEHDDKDKKIVLMEKYLRTKLKQLKQEK
ncbi:hypothetical protein AACM93_004007 [Escherichia coli]